MEHLLTLLLGAGFEEQEEREEERTEEKIINEGKKSWLQTHRFRRDRRAKTGFALFRIQDMEKERTVSL